MPLTGPDVLLYEKKDHIVYLTLNRPERLNALSQGLSDRISEAFIQFNEDDDARVAIITGTGDRAFSVGGDLKEMSEQQLGLTRRRLPSLGRDLEVWKPIIAAINGYCTAGGWSLAQNCDIRIAAEHAQFGIGEVRWSRGAPWAVPLLWMIPLGTALEILFTGQFYSSQRMYEIGFVNKVVSLPELLPTATALAEVIRDNAPLTIRAQKETMYKAMDMGRSAGLAFAEQAFHRVYTSEDALEGPRAFAEKRKPVWKGR